MYQGHITPPQIWSIDYEDRAGRRGYGVRLHSALGYGSPCTRQNWILGHLIGPSILSSAIPGSWIWASISSSHPNYCIVDWYRYGYGDAALNPLHIPRCEPQRRGSRGRKLQRMTNQRGMYLTYCSSDRISIRQWSGRIYFPFIQHTHLPPSASRIWNPPSGSSNRS